jgi:hypothetical protein
MNEKKQSGEKTVKSSTSAQRCVEKRTSAAGEAKPVDALHNTKQLLQQYRRVVYAVQVSEDEMNLRMELEHGAAISTMEVNAELAGIDLSGTKLERYAQSVIRSKNMLVIINNALLAVKRNPENGELMYHVLYLTYFSPTKPRNREMILKELEGLGYPMCLVTYHNYLNTAVRAIDRILWGYTTRDCAEIIQQFLPEK